MLSVLIETLDDEEGLARTLACLVGGAVEGVVREVVVCDRGSGDGTRTVAEHAGCEFAADGVAAAIRRAKGDWLLLLEPGAVLAEGWIGAVARHAAGSAVPARFARAAGSRAPFLSRLFSRPGALAQGLLIPRGRAAALAARAGSAEALARGLAMRTLPAGIWPARRR